MEAEWHPSRNTGGRGLDDLTGRLNGLALRTNGAARISNGGITRRTVGPVQEVANIEPTYAPPLNDSASAHEERVDAKPIIDIPDDSDPVKQEEDVTTSRPADETPNTRVAATRDINTPSPDTTDLQDPVEEVADDTQLSGETAVTDDPAQRDEVADLMPKPGSTTSMAPPVSAMQNVTEAHAIKWEVPKEVLKEVLGAKSGLSVMVQFEVRVADAV